MTDTASLDLEQLQATIREQDPVPTGSVGFIDRLAMRAGVKLVLWSRSHAAQHVLDATVVRPHAVRERVTGAAAAHDREAVRVTRMQRPISF